MSQVYGGSIVPSKQTYGSGALGVLGSTIEANTGTGPNGAGVLYNDVVQNSVANANLEFQPLLTAVPSAGTFYLYPDGSFTFSGAPNGSYSFKFIPKANGVAYAGEQTVPLTVGTASVTVDLSGSYAVQGRISTDLAGSYSVRNVLAADFAGNYFVRATVTANVAGAYSVRNAVQLDTAGAYTVRGQVVTDLSGSYSIAVAVSTVTANFVGSYEVRNAVQTDLAGAYSVLAQVVRNFSGSYKVGDGVPVRPASISYNVGPESRTVVIVDGMAQPSFPMAPGATLDFEFDWADWLDGANISSATVTTGYYMAFDEVATDDKVVRLLATLDEGAPNSMVTQVKCKITTDDVPPRTDIRTIRMHASDR